MCEEMLRFAYCLVNRFEEYSRNISPCSGRNTISLCSLLSTVPTLANFIFLTMRKR